MPAVGDIAQGLDGLTLVTAPDPAQEALTIALAFAKPWNMKDAPPPW